MGKNCKMDDCNTNMGKLLIQNFKLVKFFKNIILVIIFILANVIFCFPKICILHIFVLSMLISESIMWNIFDLEIAERPLWTGIIPVIIWLFYIVLKLFLFRWIYLRADLSTILYKGLNLFLSNFKFKILVLLLAINFDNIIFQKSFSNLYSDKFFTICIWVLMGGGVTISYLAFALCERKK